MERLSRVLLSKYLTVFQHASRRRITALTLAVFGFLFMSAVTSYAIDGSLDATFDTDGKVTTGIGTGRDHAQAVAIQSDGKIVAAGYSDISAMDAFTLVRYNNDGSLDTTFGTNGIVTTFIGTSTSYAYAVAIQSDGKIIAAGQSSNGFTLARYNTDGSLDTSSDITPGTSFGTTGIVTTVIGTGGNDVALAVAIQSDGKIVAAGSSDDGAAADFALVRYNADGSLDTTLDTDGIVTTAIGTNFEYALAVAIQSDGKIVAAGQAHIGTQYVFALVRYNTDGSLDTSSDVTPGTSFGTTGIVTTAIITGNNDIAYAVAIQSDGNIVAAGSSANGSNSVFALARYNNIDGSLDTTFGTNGIVTTRQFNNEVQHLGKQKGECYPKCLWKRTTST